MAQTILVTGSSSGFGRLTVETSATPPDPQEVANAVARVIAQPAGERPLHTVVAPVAQRQAPQGINDAVTQATRSFFEALHIPLATLAAGGEKQKLKK